MNDNQFEDSMIHAGIRKRYHNTELALTSYIDEQSAFCQFMQNKTATVNYFREEHEHVVLIDQSGNGQHVANMTARGLLLYGVPVQVLNMAKISSVLDSGYSAQAVRLNELVTDADVVVLLGAHSGNCEYPNFSKIEWFVREMIAQNTSIIFHAEEQMHANKDYNYGAWSLSFRRMFLSDAQQFDV